VPHAHRAPGLTDIFIDQIDDARFIADGSDKPQVINVLDFRCGIHRSPPDTSMQQL